MLCIGITGPTGCGKTTLLQELSMRGATVVDCDALYYELLKTDPDLRAALNGAFTDVVRPDGALDRAKLAGCVFQDPEKLAQLNEIVFSSVGAAVARQKAAAQARGTPLFAIDAINLIESGMGKSCDVILGVLAPKEKRLARIMARDQISEQAALARINAQKPDDFYRENCAYLLVNDKTQEAFRENARRLLDYMIKEEAL